MNTTYNTKLTAEQKADLKYYLDTYSGLITIVFIRRTTIALIENGDGSYLIGKAKASGKEKKLRTKVGMYYALERANNEVVPRVSSRVYAQIAEAAEYNVEDTQWYYENPDKPKDFNVVRYL